MARVNLATLVGRADNRVLKPGAFHDVYADPADEFARMARRNVLQRLAHGYYVVVPEERRDGHWQPELEAIALGIVVADYGRAVTALMGPTAARLHGAIPRALATATVAVPKNRHDLETTVGRIQFVKRDVGRIDVQRHDTTVTTGWITTTEQTVLDIADRPARGAIGPATAEEAIVTLDQRVERQHIAQLALAQRKEAAWQRYCWLVGIPALPLRHDVGTLGLRGTTDPAQYGLVETPA
jgi:predicted transcriptional regulator of viral defense system